MHKFLKRFYKSFWGKLVLGLSFFALIGIFNATKRYPKLKKEVRKATVGEVFKTWEHYKGYTYGDYFYQVNGKYYYASCTGNSSNLNNLGEKEIRKFPILYNIENPKYHLFISDHLLPQNFEIGQELMDPYVRNENLFWHIALGTAPFASEDKEELRKYLKKKTLITNKK